MPIRQTGLGKALFANRISMADCRVFRYTEDVQQALGLKTKPEPWLHVAVYCVKSFEPERRGSNDVAYNITFDCEAVVYVWDTREVIEYNDLMHHGEFITANIADSKAKKINWSALHGQPAADNFEKLNGKSGKFSNFLAGIKAKGWPIKRQYEVNLGYI